MNALTRVVADDDLNIMSLERIVQNMRRTMLSGLETVQLTRRDAVDVLLAIDRAITLEKAFDVRWDCQMEAVKRWRAINGRPKPFRDQLPDSGDLVEFLMAELEKQATSTAAQVSRGFNDAFAAGRKAGFASGRAYGRTEPAKTKPEEDTE